MVIWQQIGVPSASWWSLDGVVTASSGVLGRFRCPWSLFRFSGTSVPRVGVPARLRGFARAADAVSAYQVNRGRFVAVPCGYKANNPARFLLRLASSSVALAAPISPDTATAHTRDALARGFFRAEYGTIRTRWICDGF
uniref:(northern house mosquito) hypothetical protein n=1 Tax=Culex pipiens TaxID=7175 RepID=A0A8D8H480_CULPI